MRLLGSAVALGLGYALGRPDGRRRLRRQVHELGRRPTVRRVRERGWDLLGEQLCAVRNLAARRSWRAAAAEALSAESVPPPDRPRASGRSAPDSPPRVL
jgi:hypothetical protein